VNLDHLTKLGVTPGERLADRRPGPALPHRGHRHHWDRTLTRRGFLAGVAGMAAAGAFLGSPLGRRDVAEAAPKGPGVPQPIPNGLDLGVLFHVFVPGGFTGIDTEPSTIFDFEGVVAHGLAHGVGDRLDKHAGTTTHDVPYEVDARFMDGVYVGLDGRTHRGAFGFF
jgi:hypothetical protein